MVDKVTSMRWVGTWERADPAVADVVDGGFLEEGVEQRRLEAPAEGVGAELTVALVAEVELPHVPREHVRRCQTRHYQLSSDLAGTSLSLIKLN